MGYTHYWKAPKGISPESWKLIVRDARKVIKESANILASGDGRGKPICTASKILFNGKVEACHESFLLTAKALDFEFCKTAQKPYDVVVCAVLAIATEHASHFSVSSDGKCEDWQAGVDLCAQAGVKISDTTAERLRDKLGTYNPEPPITRPETWP